MNLHIEKLKKEYIDIVRNDFVVMKTSDSLNKNTAERLIELFKGMNITSFYKFKSLASNYTIPNIENDVFHFSLIDNLNDPFEYSYKIEIEKEKKTFRNIKVY